VVHFWWLVKTGVLRPWKVTAVLAVLLVARVVYAGMKRMPQNKGPVRAGAQLSQPG
jgi:sulfoxide reductase heme-binding subunit YedZ